MLFSGSFNLDIGQRASTSLRHHAGKNGVRMAPG
jgi:hypothetical protein